MDAIWMGYSFLRIVMESNLYMARHKSVTHKAPHKIESLEI